MSSPREKYLQVQILMGQLKEFFSRNPALFTHTGAKVTFMWFERLSSEESVSQRTFLSAYLYINLLQDAMNFARSFVYQRAHEMCLEGKNDAVCEELSKTIRALDFKESGMDDTKILENCAPIYARSVGARSADARSALANLDRCMESWNMLFTALRDKVTNIELLLKDLMGTTWQATRREIVERSKDFLYGRATGDALFVAEAAHREIFTFVNDLAHSTRVLQGDLLTRVGSIQTDIEQLKESMLRRADQLAESMSSGMATIQPTVESLKAEVRELRVMREEEGRARQELSDRIARLADQSAGLSDLQRDELQRAMSMPLEELRRQSTATSQSMADVLQRLLQYKEGLQRNDESILETQRRIEALMATLSVRETQAVQEASQKSIDDLRADVMDMQSTVSSQILKLEADIKADMKACNERVAENLRVISKHVDVTVSDMRREQHDLRQQLASRSSVEEISASVRQIESDTSQAVMGMKGLVSQDQYRAMMDRFSDLEQRFIQQGDATRARIVHLEKSVVKYQLLLLSIFILVVVLFLAPSKSAEVQFFS